MICNNCGANAEGKYCSNCGQKLGVGRVTVHELAHDTWHGVTHTDKGVLKLFKDLTIRPRTFFQEYLKGKRKTYFSPVVFSCCLPVFWRYFTHMFSIMRIR